MRMTNRCGLLTCSPHVVTAPMVLLHKVSMLHSEDKQMRHLTCNPHVVTAPIFLLHQVSTRSDRNRLRIEVSNCSLNAKVHVSCTGKDVAI